MIARAAMVAAMLAGCGRLGFDDRVKLGTSDPDGSLAGDARGDGGGPAAPPDGGSPGTGTTAITLVGVSPYTEWFNASNTMLGLGIPAGTKDGDLIVVHATWDAGSTWTAPAFSGFADTVPAFTDPKCGGSSTEVISKIGVALAMMPVPKATCTGNCMARVSVYRGVDQTTPIDAIGALGSTVEACGSSATPRPHAIPGAVTTVAGDLLVLLYGDGNTDNVGGTSAAMLPPAVDAMYTDVDVDANNEALVGGTVAAPAGVGPVAAQTVLTTDQTVHGWTAVMLALKPAS